MTKGGITSTVLLCLLSMGAMLLGGCASGPDKLVVPMHSTVEGHELNEYASLWWQWAYSMNPEDSAVVDETGEKCHVNQAGDVWYLAGGYGTSLIQRTCEVPKGKYVFFPVINIVYGPSSRGRQTCAETMVKANMHNASLMAIDVAIDGQPVSHPEQFLLKSPDCFDLAAAIPEEQGAGRVYPSAAAGYWIMLKPLSRGTHTVKFAAIYNPEYRAPMAQDIEYTLIVD